MADSKHRKWSKKRIVLVSIIGLIALAILYQWLLLWGIAVLGIGLFLLWQFAPLSQKVKVAACLIFAVVIGFGAYAWNAYNVPPKITFDNSLANSTSTDNKTTDYTITGHIASPKAVHLTINGTNVPLTSSDDYSYKTNLKEGDNNYTFVATNGSGEDREAFTIHRNTQAEDTADASSNSNSDSSNNSTPAPAAPTKAQQVSDWFNKYDYLIKAYGPDFDQIGVDAGNHDTVAVGNDCQKLSDDVAAAQKAPAIPDAQAASDFSSALTYYQAGATQCVTAANNNDNQGLVDAAATLTKGNDKIKATTADINAAKNQ